MRSSEGMTMKAIQIGLLLNVLLAIVFVYLFLGLPFLTQLSASGRYTELDRAGVINMEALRAYDAALAENNRYLVPRWLTETAVSHERQIAGLGVATALANALAMAFLGASFLRIKRELKSQRSTSVPKP